MSAIPLRETSPGCPGGDPRRERVAHHQLTRAAACAALLLAGCPIPRRAPALDSAAGRPGSPSTGASLPPKPRRKEPPSGIEGRALAPGRTAPAFVLPAAAGERWALKKQLARGPVVLVFYRGHW